MTFICGLRPLVMRDACDFSNASQLRSFTAEGGDGGLLLSPCLQSPGPARLVQSKLQSVGVAALRSLGVGDPGWWTPLALPTALF